MRVFINNGSFTKGETVALTLGGCAISAVTTAVVTHLLTKSLKTQQVKLTETKLQLQVAEQQKQIASLVAQISKSSAEQATTDMLANFQSMLMAAAANGLTQPEEATNAE